MITMGILAFHTPTPQPAGIGIFLIALSTNILLGIGYKTIDKNIKNMQLEKIFWISCIILIICMIHGMSWGFARLGFFGTIAGISILEIIIYKDNNY